MKSITIASELNSYRTSIDAIREQINRELVDIFTRGSYGANASEVRKNLDHLRIFIGFEFNLYNVDDNGRNVLIHRSAGF